MLLSLSWDVYYWTMSVVIYVAAIAVSVIYPGFFGPVPPLGIW